MQATGDLIWCIWITQCLYEAECSIYAPSIYLPNLLFCGIHCHVYRAYLVLLRTSYPLSRSKLISEASNLFPVSPIVPQQISLRIPRARFLALGWMMKQYMKRCLLRVVSARGSISNRFEKLQAIKEVLTISRSAPPELELIQTQMTQKPMLRAEVYARALRASQNRKEDSL